MSVENGTAERRAQAASENLQDLTRRGRLVKSGRPVEVREFDQANDIIILAFDPAQTPAPHFELLDGYRPGEKVLTMNGAQMAWIANAADLTLADVTLLETRLGR